MTRLIRPMPFSGLGETVLRADLDRIQNNMDKYYQERDRTS